LISVLHITFRAYEITMLNDIELHKVEPKGTTNIEKSLEHDSKIRKSTIN